jgi:uncharacterized protein YkwD
VPLRAVILALVFASGFLACAGPTSPDPEPTGGGTPTITTTPPSEAAAAIVDLTNAERTRNGLAAVRANGQLMQAAQIHADQMARLGRLDHVLPEAQYPRPEDRINAAGYRWRAYAENLAWGQRNPAEAVSGWMESPGHRTNILNATYTELGAGYALDPERRAYYVQVFARPQ